ncbi:MAG: SulP family inorganic anion transporter [Methylophilaceae bacterium]|nr:SulP family inorganic anion transporter [Methylophilaceae bacterium]
MKIARLKPHTGDFWGGLAAMLVALPAAIAFGVTIYAPLGASYAAQGALAGILGVTAIGLLASLFGGTHRLISAPCAPAAAVLSAFVIEFMHGGNLEAALLMLALLGLMAGMLQIAFGSIGLGTLIKYMPYPVVSGYLSGVGLYIIASQMPRLLGIPPDMHLWESLVSLPLWKWQAMTVGAVTITAMLLAPRITQTIPAAILALSFGIATYFALGLVDESLWRLEDNSLVVGTLGGGGQFADIVIGRWEAARHLEWSDVSALVMPAFTLAILLSIDTLKTCVVLDALTRSRHDSNRELIGQGIGNIASAIVGGIPGAGTMGATLVNMSSGATSRVSGLIESVLALLAFLSLGTVIAWVPVAALAGILIVVGLRMIDLHTLRYLKSRSTALDFMVIAIVVCVALTVSLIAASAIGIALAILLFVREQIGGKVVRRKAYGNQTFSRNIRRQEEMEILIENGDRSVIFELQGSLFFGTTDQLYTALEHELKKSTRLTYVILDMRRVQSVDVTASHMLEQVKDMLAERSGFLIFAQIPSTLPSGKDMKEYFDHVGLLGPDSPVKVFGEVDEAVEWVEDRILAEARIPRAEETLLSLHEIELFAGRKPETLSALEAHMQQRTYKAGETIFAAGDSGDELYLIRRGEVRILLPVGDNHSHHISTFGRGAFFGEMSFLDGNPRSATAVANRDTDLYVISRQTFDQVAEEHKKLGLNLMEGLARVLAGRLRYANAEMQALEA